MVYGRGEASSLGAMSPRILVPTLALGLFAALTIGCGGDSSSSADTGGLDGGGSTGAISVVPSQGTYTSTLQGNDGTTSFTGAGSGTVGSNGVLQLSFPSVLANGAGTPVARTVSASVTSSGSVSGTVTVGANAAANLTGSATRLATGVLELNVSFTNSASKTEADTYTITATTPAAGTYKGTVSGTDDQHATYSGTDASVTIGTGGTLSGTYTSSRKLSGAAVSQEHTISGATLQPDGTFAATLGIGAGVGARTVAATGTWSLGGDNVLTVVLNYTDTGTVSVNGASPKVSETLELTLSN